MGTICVTSCQDDDGLHDGGFPSQWVKADITIQKTGRQVGRAVELEVSCGEKGFEIFPDKSPDVNNGAKKTILWVYTKYPTEGSFYSALGLQERHLCLSGILTPLHWISEPLSPCCSSQPAGKVRSSGSKWALVVWALPSALSHPPGSMSRIIPLRGRSGLTFLLHHPPAWGHSVPVRDIWPFHLLSSILSLLSSRDFSGSPLS